MHKMEICLDENSLFDFVMSDDELERSDSENNYIISFQLFERLYVNWCKKKSRTMIDMTNEHKIKVALKNVKLTLRFERHIINNISCEGFWIIGIRRREPLVTR